MKRINLGKGKTTILDDEDYKIFHKMNWYLHKAGKIKEYAGCYFRTPGKSNTLLLHREILGLKIGDKKQVDHINGKGLDNRKINLRICSQRFNAINSCKKRGYKKYKGVYFKSKHTDNKWVARIIIHYKKPGYQDIWIGSFNTPEKAALAYNKKAKELWGEFAYQNEVTY